MMDCAVRPLHRVLDCPQVLIVNKVGSRLYKGHMNDEKDESGCFLEKLAPAQSLRGYRFYSE